MVKLRARQDCHIVGAKWANDVQRMQSASKSRSKFVFVVIICDGLNIGGMTRTEIGGEVSWWVRQLLLFLVAKLGMLSKIQFRRRFQLYVVKISTVI